MATSIASLSLVIGASTAGLQRDLTGATGMIDKFAKDSDKNLAGGKGFDLSKMFLGGGGGGSGGGGGLGSLGQAFSKIPGLGGIGDAVAGLSEGLGGAVGGIEALSAALGPETAGISLLVGATVAAGAALLSFTDTMFSLAKVANPAAYERFNMAWNDLYGVIGQRFVPLLNLATDGVRLMADFLATILPSVADVQSVANSFAPVMQDLRDILADIAPLVKQQLTDAFVKLAIVLKIAATALHEVLSIANQFSLSATSMSQQSLTSSFGAAGRQASFYGSIEDVSKKAIEGAYSQQMPGGQSSPELSYLDRIAKGIDTLVATGQPSFIEAATTAAKAGWNGIQTLRY